MVSTLLVGILMTTMSRRLLLCYLYSIDSGNNGVLNHLKMTTRSVVLVWETKSTEV
jgi:hypothetical protein